MNIEVLYYIGLSFWPLIFGMTGVACLLGMPQLILLIDPARTIPLREVIRRDRRKGSSRLTRNFGCFYLVYAIVMFFMPFDPDSQVLGYILIVGIMSFIIHGMIASTPRTQNPAQR